MTRLPIRARMAAAFAVAMAAVLAATGVVLYTRLGDDLSAALDTELQLRGQDLAKLARDPHGSIAGGSPVQLIERGESFAQLLTPGGAVLQASSLRLRTQPLLGASRRRAGLRGPRFSSLPAVPGLDEGVRLLSLPVRRRGRRLVLVVGATAENRREALRSLRDELLIAGPLALVVATGLGYGLAGTGLRTVDAMRARAARISADRPHERLPVPPTGDELHRLGITLNDMLGRLQDAVARERGFVAEAGHELRTPLALMRAELDYALHYATGEEELRATVRVASEETDRLVALAGALLLIASSDRDRVDLRPEPVPVGDLLESVRRRFAWRAEELGRPLVVDPANGVAVEGDRLRLEQALGNLLDNALRHGDGCVRIDARPADDGVLLAVADDGPGFDRELLPRAFQRFSRGRDRHAAEGSGLGLAVVQAIAQAHGGEAWARNGDAGGAEVVLRLPGARSRPG